MLNLTEKPARWYYFLSALLGVVGGLILVFSLIGLLSIYAPLPIPFPLSLVYPMPIFLRLICLVAGFVAGMVLFFLSKEAVKKGEQLEQQELEAYLEGP